MKVDEQLLVTELNKSFQKNRLKQVGITIPAEETQSTTLPTSPTQMPVDEVSELDTEMQEWEVIRLMINYGHTEIEVGITNDDGLEENIKVHIASYICASLVQNEISFNNGENQIYFEGYLEEIEKSVIPEIQQLTSHELESVRNLTISLLHESYLLSPNWRSKFKLRIPEKDADLSKLVNSVINKLKQKKLLRIIIDLQAQIKDCKDDAEIENLLIEMNGLIEVKKVLWSDTGTSIIH